MAGLAKKNDENVRHDVAGGLRGRWLDAAFQVCLAWFMMALTWHLLGPVPETKFDYFLQLAVLWLGYAFSIWLWILRSRRLPLVCIPVLLTVGFVATVDSARTYDASFQVMIPAKVRDGRVIHDGIGLSYALFPGCQVDLQPQVKRNIALQANGNPTAPLRLHLEEVARLCRIVLAPRSQQNDDSSMVIQLDVVYDRPRGLSSFVRRVRDFERSLVSRPKMRVIRSTHRSRIAGLDTVEFEYFNDQQKRIYRQVQLRAGQFMLNFSLHYVDEADRPHVDEFLNSIRLASPKGIVAWLVGCELGMLR